MPTKRKAGETKISRITILIVGLALGAFGGFMIGLDCIKEIHAKDYEKELAAAIAKSDGWNKGWDEAWAMKNEPTIKMVYIKPDTEAVYQRGYEKGFDRGRQSMVKP